jgi:integrase
MELNRENVANAKLPAGKSDAIFFDDDLPGFGLRIREGGKRTWIIQYRIGRKQRRLTVGSVEKLSLDRARKEAKVRLAQVELGGDPQKEKHQARAAARQTVGALIQCYLAQRHWETGDEGEGKYTRLRKSSYVSTEIYLQQRWKPLHDLQVKDVDRFRIASELSAIKAAASSVTAARARVALSTMFAWAIGEGIADTNPVVGTNKPANPKPRDRVLQDGEIAEIWEACRDDSFGQIVKLLLLTGTRRDEIGDLAWVEIDLDRDVIELPPERTKNGRPHTVPLAPIALDVLKSVKRRSREGDAAAYLFGEGKGGFSGWSKAKAALDRRINDARKAKVAGKKGGKFEAIEEWRLHDLRRTCATVMADKLGVLPHIIEATLNHISGHKAGTAGVYNLARYEPEVRKALLVWADYLKSVVERTDPKVVPLRPKEVPA